MRRKTALLGWAMTTLVARDATTAADDGDWFQQGRAAVSRAKQVTPITGRAKNVILFIGDGMGVTTVTAARIFEGQRRGEPGEENLLSFEKLPYTALIKTYNTDAQVADSAGTMTAIVTGAKTRIGVLSVGEKVRRDDHVAASAHRLATILELAERAGLATGIVTTTRVTHATPAACYAHSPQRDWEDDSDLPVSVTDAGFPDIARQLVEFSIGDGIEVVFGGGRANFMLATNPDPEYVDKKGRRRDGRDLIAEWIKSPGSVYVWNKSGFDGIDASSAKRVLGLFEASHMRYEHDRPGDKGGEPSLSEMTRKAIQLLSRNPRGFFLMVEGGRIDHAHHETNAYRALSDTVEFAAAVRVAVENTNRLDTLTIVTADHSHVFTMAGYPSRGNPILGKVTDCEATGEDHGKLTCDSNGLPFTTLGYANGPGCVGGASRPDLTQVATDHPDYKQEAAVPLRSETHGGEDVPLYADGPHAHLFRGVLEQNVIFHVMVEALGLAGGE
jgi:alkaline phosphatase